MASSRSLLWSAFAVFVVVVLFIDGHAGMFALYTPLASVKLGIWATFLAFVAFSLYCSARENLFTTVTKIGELHWGRQIGLDLYLGLGLSLLVIYLNEGSLLTVLLWLLPMLVFANMATLLYFAVHFDQIVGRFL